MLIEDLTMIQGKIMNILQIRSVCTDLFIGKSQRKIAKEFHISRATLIKFSKKLKQGGVNSIQEIPLGDTIVCEFR